MYILYLFLLIDWRQMLAIGYHLLLRTVHNTKQKYV